MEKEEHLAKIRTLAGERNTPDTIRVLLKDPESNQPLYTVEAIQAAIAELITIEEDRLAVSRVAISPGSVVESSIDNSALEQKVLLSFFVESRCP